MEGVIPSFATGFARHRGESKYPDLWDGLVGLWAPFLGATGGQLFDLSGNGNTGTLIADTHFISGPFGPVLSFDGTGDYVALNRHISFADDVPWTISFRAKSNDAGTALKAVLGDSVNSNFWVILRQGNYIYWKSASGEIETIPEMSDFSAWNHFVFTPDIAEGKLRTYVNGSLLAYDPLDNSSVEIDYIGRTSASVNYDWNGLVDNLTVWKRILSASEAAFISYHPTALLELADTPILKAAAAPGSLEVNVYDGIISSESITPSLPLYEISISETTKLVENITSLLPLLLADVSDLVNVNESITSLLPLLESTLFDSVISSEIITPLMPLYQANVSEETKLVEDIAPSLVGLDTLSVNIFEVVNIADILQSQLPLYEVEEYETVSVYEYKNIVLGHPVESVSVSDSIKTADTVGGLLTVCEVSVSETIKTNDILSPYMILSQWALMMGANF